MLTKWYLTDKRTTDGKRMEHQTVKERTELSKKGKAPKTGLRNSTHKDVYT